MPVVSCYRNGAIVIGQRQPAGTRLIIKAPGRKLREQVEVNARHAYDGKTLLVPGVPEAASDAEAKDAVEYFAAILRMRLAGEQGWPKPPARFNRWAAPAKAGAA